MSANIGNIDRIVRLVLGLVLITLAVSGLAGAWAYVGLVLVATAAMRFCPLYRLLGVNTCAR